MLEFSEITLGDKAYFDRFLNLYNPEISELTFTNLFMWRNAYKFRFTEICGLLCILSVPEKDEPFAFIPVGKVMNENFLEAYKRLKGYFTANNWSMTFKRVPESALGYFDDFIKDEKEIVFDENSSDYVYLTSDLIELKGKKYDGKRNHINRFLKQYDYEYVDLDESHTEECIRIIYDWCAQRDCNLHRELYCEKKANIELMNNYRDLECRGALIKVNGRFEAFATGDMLNNDTAVIHIEKANNKINGLYTFINQQFCENEWKHTTYINREQDLGIEGLRKAKMSYNPVKMIRKYTVVIK